MVVPALYLDQVQAHQPSGAIRSWADGEDPTDILRDIAAGLGRCTGRVLVDDTLWAGHLLAVQDALQNTG